MKLQTPDRRMVAEIFTLAWPTMLEQLMQTAVQYIDTAMVSLLSTQATAAVGSTTTMNWLVNSTITALGIGFLALISRALGAGDQERARRASAQAVLTVLVVGVFFTVLMTTLSSRIPAWMQVDAEILDLASRYFLILYSPMLFRSATLIFGTVLRSAGDSKTPMRVGILMNIINIILNFVFIYPTRDIRFLHRSLTLPGLGWGVQGAAAASAMAFVIGGLLISLRLWRHPLVSPRGHSLKPDLSILRPCLRVALPNMLQRFATNLGYVVFASMVNALGNAATAAHTIANTVESLFYIPGYGMQAAAATLAGNALGAWDAKRLRSLTRNLIPLEVGLMTVSGGLLFLLAPQMMSLFSRDATVVSLGIVFLRMVAVSEPCYGVSIVLEGVMQGVGRTVPPFIFNVSAMWLVRIVGAFICTQVLGLGLISAWACMVAHNMTVFLLFAILFARSKALPDLTARPQKKRLDTKTPDSKTPPGA